jgi:hypothetical protein
MNWKPIAIFVVGTAAGFLLAAPGPIGKMIWPMADGLPDPEGSNVVLLAVMGFFEAVAFGLGITFLVYGLPTVRSVTRGTSANPIAVYLSIAWLLVNWVPHTSLHMNHGNLVTPADFTGLVAIEYGFHLTLIVAGTFIAHAVVQASRLRTGTATTVATTKPRPN